MQTEMQPVSQASIDANGQLPIELSAALADLRDNNTYTIYPKADVLPDDFLRKYLATLEN